MSCHDFHGAHAVILMKNQLAVPQQEKVVGTK
jgi:hypothetical protein